MSSYMGKPPVKAPQTETVYEYTAVNGQTSFSAAYAPGHVSVFVNGLLKPIATYTATDGLNVVLGTPCAGGETVIIVGRQGVSYATALTLATGDGRYARLNSQNNYSKGQYNPPLALPATTGSMIFDFNEGNNWAGQVTGSVTFANGFLNPHAGQAGLIRVRQHGSSIYNWAFGSYWKYIGGSARIPAQSQAVNSYDEIVYHINSATEISFHVRSDVK